MPHQLAGAPSTRRPRGLYLSAAPEGMVRVVVIDSHGHEFANLLLHASAYNEQVGDWLRRRLDAADPVRPPLLLHRA